MLELLRGMFSELLRGLPSCSRCRGKGALRCDQPQGLTLKGELTSDVGGGDIVVSWPGCPQRWYRLREWGQDLLPLSSVVAWAYEQQAHIRLELGAGLERLIREWAVRREQPEALLIARRAENRGSS